MIQLIPVSDCCFITERGKWPDSAVSSHQFSHAEVSIFPLEIYHSHNLSLILKSVTQSKSIRAKAAAAVMCPKHCMLSRESIIMSCATVLDVYQNDSQCDHCSCLKWSTLTKLDCVRCLVLGIALWCDVCVGVRWVCSVKLDCNAFALGCVLCWVMLECNAGVLFYVGVWRVCWVIWGVMFLFWVGMCHNTQLTR